MDCGSWTANSWKHPKRPLAGHSHKVKAREGWNLAQPLQIPNQHRIPAGECQKWLFSLVGSSYQRAPGKHSSGAITMHID